MTFRPRFALFLLCCLFSAARGFPEVRTDTTATNGFTSSQRSNVARSVPDGSDNATTRSPCINIPCGFAHYSTESTRFRPITEYTRNRMCACQDDYHCVLTGNRVDRKAYVFHCRKIETSGYMYKFPNISRFRWIGGGTS